MENTDRKLEFVLKQSWNIIHTALHRGQHWNMQVGWMTEWLPQVTTSPTYPLLGTSQLCFQVEKKIYLFLIPSFWKLNLFKEVELEAFFQLEQDKNKARNISAGDFLNKTYLSVPYELTKCKIITKNIVVVYSNQILLKSYVIMIFKVLSFSPGINKIFLVN